MDVITVTDVKIDLFSNSHISDDQFDLYTGHSNLYMLLLCLVMDVVNLKPEVRAF